MCSVSLFRHQWLNILSLHIRRRHCLSAANGAASGLCRLRVILMAASGVPVVRRLGGGPSAGELPDTWLPDHAGALDCGRGLRVCLIMGEITSKEDIIITVKRFVPTSLAGMRAGDDCSVRSSVDGRSARSFH